MTLALRLLRGGRLTLLGAAALSALALLFGVGLNATGGALLTRAAQHPPTLLTLTFLITGVRAFGVGRAGLRYAERLVSHALSLRLLARTRVALYARLLPLGRELLVRERAGTLLAAAGPDVDTLQDAYLRVLSPALAFALLVLVTCGFLTLLSPALAVIALALLLLAGAAPLVLARTHARLVARRDAARTTLTSELLEGLAARADLGHADARATLTRHADDLAATDARFATLTAAATLIRELCAGAALLAALLLLPGSVSAPLLVAAALSAVTAFEGAAPLAALPAALAGVRAAAHRLDALLALTPDVKAPARPQPLPSDAHHDLTDVRVELGGRAVLNGLNLSVPAGASVALIGESGAGKTTLLRLLTRDLDPQGGRVTRGGQPLPNLDPGALLQRVAVLDQDAPLLDASVRDNLRLGNPDAPEGRLRDLLDRLGLHALHLDDWVGEGGARLSGGQRQRLALARTLLKPSDTLILDEPTAQLDPESEARALRVIQEERAHRTLILATHRAPPLALAQRTYRLHAGKLEDA